MDDLYRKNWIHVDAHPIIPFLATRALRYKLFFVKALTKRLRNLTIIT